ncbi:MAG TPA: phosphate acyltransferase, partial [Clostridia bacterium]|nr:phosphate acyltransferase [Clostridia bacterium]
GKVENGGKELNANSFFVILVDEGEAHFQFICADQGCIACRNPLLAPCLKNVFLYKPAVLCYNAGMITSFSHVISEVQKSQAPPIAVAGAEDPHVLESICAAKDSEIMDAILVGNGEKIKAGLQHIDMRGANLQHAGRRPSEFRIEHVDGEPAAVAERTVQLVLEGEAGSIMKGFMDTSVLLKAVLAREELKTGRFMSVLGIIESPHYNKLLFLTDSGFIPRPTLEQKIDLIKNGVDLVEKLGGKIPKVGVVCAVEKVNDKMPDTLDAAELARLNQQGDITGCIVEGPLGFDNAVSAEAAAHKGVQGQVPGDADILLFPDLVSANSVYKTFGFLTDSKTAGYLAGAQVPIIITSRADSVETKLNSLAMVALASKATSTRS